MISNVPCLLRVLAKDPDPDSKVRVPQKVRILDPDPEPQWTRSKYEAHSRTTRTSTLLNVGTVGIILLFKFRIAVGIRTVCGGTILVSSEGGHLEQITSRIPLKLHCQFLFVASERHSCQKVGI